MTKHVSFTIDEITQNAATVRLRRKMADGGAVKKSTLLIDMRLAID